MTTAIQTPETTFQFDAPEALTVELPQNLPAVQLEAHELISKPWTAEMAVRGAEVFKSITEAEKKIKDLFESPKAMRHGAHQVVCQAETSWLKPFAELKKAMKERSTAYLLEQERIQKAAEEAARKKAEDERLRLAAIEEEKAETARKVEAAKREEAEAQRKAAQAAADEAARKEREAQEAEAAGEAAKAQALKEAADRDRQAQADAQAASSDATSAAKAAETTATTQDAKVEKLISAPVRVGRVTATPPTPKGMTLVKTWKGRVTDMAQLITACATGLAPEGVLEVNQAKLDKWAKDTEGTATVPGIEAYEHSDTANR